MNCFFYFFPFSHCIQIYICNNELQLAVLLQWGTEKSYYEVYKLKCTSKIKTTLPKKFYIIVSYSNDNLDELYISESEPKSIKKVKKSGKISLQ